MPHKLQPYLREQLVYVGKTLANSKRLAIKDINLARPHKELLEKESQHLNVVNFIESYLVSWRLPYHDEQPRSRVARAARRPPYHDDSEQPCEIRIANCAVGFLAVSCELKNGDVVLDVLAAEDSMTYIILILGRSGIFR
ncbi:hypothetical protein C8J57DRAFT_1252731 [Mycena rebaudengoi]|nr:hypothetical protein C8J57DRAFT_1252731 [Mycena rebaudengoi]